MHAKAGKLMFKKIVRKVVRGEQTKIDIQMGTLSGNEEFFPEYTERYKDPEQAEDRFRSLQCMQQIGEFIEEHKINSDEVEGRLYCLSGGAKDKFLMKLFECYGLPEAPKGEQEWQEEI